MARLVTASVLRIVMLLIGLLAVGYEEVWAKTVKFSFSGTVISVNPDVISAIGGTDVVDVGDVIAGSFVYDLDTPGTVGGTGPGGIVIRTDYPSPAPPARLTYSVGGLTVTTEPGGDFIVIVGNSMPSNVSDLEVVDTFIVGGGTVSEPAPLSSVLRLEDTFETVFSDTDLPKKLRTKDFDVRQFEVYSITPAGFAELMFVATIDKIRRGGGGRL